MRLLELFLNETTEEDRALVSLSSAIYDNIISPNLNTEPSEEPTELGKIGDHLDTPFEKLNDVSIDLQSGDAFIKRAIGPKGKHDGKPILGVWDYDTNTIVLNTEYLTHERMRTIIAHELRHVLDDKKSNDQAGMASRKDSEKPNAYNSPRKTAHKKEPKDDYQKDWRYTAARSEINARFLEVMDVMVRKRIPLAYKTSPPDEIRARLSSELPKVFNTYEIGKVFPERTESPDYKRLIRRGMDMLQKETAHYEQELAKAGKPIKATGNW